MSVTDDFAAATMSLREAYTLSEACDTHRCAQYARAAADLYCQVILDPETTRAQRREAAGQLRAAMALDLESVGHRERLLLHIRGQRRSAKLI